MAEYFSARPRTEEEIAQEMMARQKLVEAIRSNPHWERMRGPLNEGQWPPVSGEEAKANFYTNLGLLSPTSRMKSSQLAEDTYNNLGTAGEAALTGLMHAFDGGGRLRDAAFRTAQDAYSGNPYGAAMNATAMLTSPFFPELAVGGQGMPDDWRKYATGPGTAFFLDVATDPLNYMTLGVAKNLKYAIPAARAAVRAAEPAGEAIRRLVQKYPVPAGAAAGGGGLMYYGLSSEDK